MCASLARRRRAVPAHLHRRGLRLDRVGSFLETDRLGPPLAVQRVQGRFRPHRPLVPRDLRPTGRRHPVVEQLRAVPVPREGHPVVRHQPARGDKVPLVRRRPQHPRLVLRRRQLRRRRSGAAQGEIGEIYNIGAATRSPTGSSPNDPRRARKATNDRVRRGPLGHDRRYSIDCSKIRALGWAPERDLREALEPTVEWYRDNRWWWEPLKAA